MLTQLVVQSVGDRRPWERAKATDASKQGSKRHGRSNLVHIQYGRPLLSIYISIDATNMNAKARK